METYSRVHPVRKKRGRESLRYRDCWQRTGKTAFRFKLALVENTARQKDLSQLRRRNRLRSVKV